MGTSFGHTLQRIRRSKGLRQREVAKRIDMDYGYFSKLENDRFDSKPTRETVSKIADAMNCTPEELGELLNAAGRLDEEMERLAKAASDKPRLKELMSSASMLPTEKLEQILQQVLDELARESEGGDSTNEEEPD